MEQMDIDRIMDVKSLMSFLNMRKMILLKIADNIRLSIIEGSVDFMQDPKKFMLMMPKLHDRLADIEDELLAIEQIMTEIPALHEAS